jgi:5-methyltetrahydropteroyltriglutamate--homocysteine methyltransferase
MTADPKERHDFVPAASFDGGDLDCGNGLLLLIRKNLDPLENGQLLEIISTETAVEADLPSWCRLTSNELVSWTKEGKRRSFLICKGRFDPRSYMGIEGGKQERAVLQIKAITIPERLPEPAPVPPIPNLSVTGIGSWPRPRWLLQALHERLEQRLPESDFQATADDAIKLSVESQLKAGVDIVTDGEQRRDNYASFVGSILDNCQLIPLTDLLPLVDDPGKLEKELQSMDVPADKVRHPVVFGPLGRSKSIAVHEFEYLKRLTDKPVKVALPGPYLLSRTLWLDCLTDKVYDSRSNLSKDIVRVLREEIHFLLAAGADLVQLDEPVLTEVVFTGAKNTRSFMCGALSERGETNEELQFAADLINAVVTGLPRTRTAVHICRGNWTPDESVALSGSYHRLMPVLEKLDVGTLFLEFCTPRAGDLEIIKALPETVKIGLGAVNPKDPRIESIDEVLSKTKSAIDLVGFERLLLTPDCGFATFADNPVSSAEIAEAKLHVLAEAAAILRGN